MARAASAVSAHFMRRIIAIPSLVMIAERHAHCPGTNDAGPDRSVRKERKSAEYGRSRGRGHAMAVAEVLDIGLDIKATEIDAGIEVDHFIGPNVPLTSEG